MTETMKWQHNETGVEGNYSPELKDAIELLDELKEEEAEPLPLKIAAEKAARTGSHKDLQEYMRLRRIYN